MEAAAVALELRFPCLHLDLSAEERCEALLSVVEYQEHRDTYPFVNRQRPLGRPFPHTTPELDLAPAAELQAREAARVDDLFPQGIPPPVPEDAEHLAMLIQAGLADSDPDIAFLGVVAAPRVPSPIEGVEEPPLWRRRRRPDEPGAHAEVPREQPPRHRRRRRREE